MPGVDGADAVGGLEQRVEQRIVVHARQRIDGVEAVRDQRCDRRLRGGHGHGGRHIRWCAIQHRPRIGSLGERVLSGASVQIGGSCRGHLPLPGDGSQPAPSLTSPPCMCLSAPKQDRFAPCIATVPTPAARCARPTSATTCGCPAGATASATTAASCSSTLRDHYGMTQCVADPEFAGLQGGREAALGMGGADRRQGAQAPGRHRQPRAADRRGRGLHQRHRGAGAGRRAADAGVRRPGISRGDPAQVPLPRSASRPACTTTS